MGNLWSVLEWIALALGIAVAAFAAAFAVLRRRILRHVRRELGQESLLLAAGARVGGTNGMSGSGRPPAAAGILMLLSTGLYFHSWIGIREVFIPGPSISWIGVADARVGRHGDRHRVVVRFLDASGKQDGVAINLMYPEQWVDAIKTHLITRS